MPRTSSSRVSLLIQTFRGHCRRQETEHLKLYSGHSQCSKILLGTRNPSLFESPPSDKVVLIKSSESSGEAKAVTFPDLFRSEPLPVVPISFSSVVSSAPQTPRKPNPPAAEQDGTSQSEDLEVEVYDWEELPKDNIDEWTEARKKGHKKVAAGSKPTPGSAKKASASASPAMSGKKDKKFKRGGVKHRKDYGVRDMKPRPCHSHYLSTCTVIRVVLMLAYPLQARQDAETTSATTATNMVGPPFSTWIGARADHGRPRRRSIERTGPSRQTDSMPVRPGQQVPF